MLFKQANQRISTGQLNKLIKIAMEKHEPPLYQLKRPKVYYATQVSEAPPTIVLVCNNPQGIPAPYQRYLLGFLRDHLPFGEIPIRLFLQARKRDDERDDLGVSEQQGTPSFTVDGEVYELDEEDDFEDDNFEEEGYEDDEIEDDLQDESDDEFADQDEDESLEDVVDESGDEFLDEEGEYEEDDLETAEADSDYEDLEIELEPPSEQGPRILLSPRSLTRLPLRSWTMSWMMSTTFLCTSFESQRNQSQSSHNNRGRSILDWLRAPIIVWCPDIVHGHPSDRNVYPIGEHAKIGHKPRGHIVDENSCQYGYQSSSDQP